MEKTTTFAEKAIKYLNEVTPPPNLPQNIGVLNPYQEIITKKIVRQFFFKFYNDSNERTVLFGINPGRFGGGVTGLSFTDPVTLEKYCDIVNSWPKKSELSSTFIYEVIRAYGGVELFFSNFFLSALSPLGFIQNGINLNYYDISNYKSIFYSYCVEEIEKHLAMGINNKKAYCIGMGKNVEFFKEINERHRLFKEILALPHPRWVMQYQRKNKSMYIDLYLNHLLHNT